MRLVLTMKLKILELNFLLYTMGGIWRPVDWSSRGVKLLYSVFSFYAIFSMYSMLLTQFLDIVLVVDNVNDFVNNCLLFTGFITVCCKATVAITRRDAIIDLAQTLLREPCEPRNEEEASIRTKVDRFIRSASIKFSLLSTGSVTGVTINAVLNVMQGILPYRVWLPYDSSTSLMFWITSVHQITSVIIATIINVGTETLVFGFLLQTCAQLEILGCRLRKLATDEAAERRGDVLSRRPGRGKSIVSAHIRHHLQIYNYAKTLNKIFNQVLFLQFVGSILVLCTAVYYLSMHFGELESVTLLVYIACMFAQIYLYCWSGNEVILKSISIGDAVYHMDWFLLSVRERKDLLMIMRRSATPIRFSSSFLITLSIESYCNILKTSYSAFNLMQQQS